MSAASSACSRSFVRACSHLRSFVSCLLVASAMLASACSRQEPRTEAQQAVDAAADKSLHVLQRPGYFAPETLPDFQSRTGIEVTFQELDSDGAIEERLLAGKSGFDVVVISSSFLARQVRAGLFAKLDKGWLPNLHYVDPQSLERAQRHDPGNEQSIPYTWGTTGIAYNRQRIDAVMSDAPVDSWRLVFDPELAARFAKCGLYLPDAPEEVVSLALVSLGRDPADAQPEDFAVAERLLAAVRPYAKPVPRSRYVQELAAGNLCVAIARSTDLLAGERSGKRDADTVGYAIPREGTLVWYDVLAIPADSGHSRNAHAFVDYLLEPRVAANNANFGRHANANAGSDALLDDDLKTNGKIYPSTDQQERLFALPTDNEAFAREAARIWSGATHHR
jgi:putrescine transport system substrate-binding protein